MESHVPTSDADVVTDGSYVRIFDTTLRDGEQAPGATMSHAEKLEVARALARLGVDGIEAPRPAAAHAAAAARPRAERLEVARALARLGVDVIEAGFPAASPGDLEAVRA